MKAHGIAKSKKSAPRISRALNRVCVFVCCRFLFTSNDNFEKLKLWLFVCGFVFLLSSTSSFFVLVLYSMRFISCVCVCAQWMLCFFALYWIRVLEKCTPSSSSFVFMLSSLSRLDQIILFFFHRLLLCVYFAICIYSHYMRCIALDSQLRKKNY